MDKLQTQEAIKVMQAWVDGATIQHRFLETRPPVWFETDRGSPKWNWDEVEYRIKPLPMEIEVWVHPDGKDKVINDPPTTRYGYNLRRFREIL